MKQTFQLAALSAANIGLTFLFQWYTLTQLGPGLATDALFAGMTVPQLVLTVISGSLMHVLVPLLAGEREEDLRHDAWAFLILVASMFGLLATILYALAPWWVPITVPGFDLVGQTLTVELTRIQLLGMLFTAINGVQWATYHAKKKFIWADLAVALASALALVVLIWALPRFGVISAAIISTARMGLQTLLLSPAMGLPVRVDLKKPVIREAWSRIRPLILGTTYYKTDALLDRFLLSGASRGSLSLYYLAQQIYGAASQVISKAIAIPLVPELSDLYKQGKLQEFRRIYLRKLWQVSMICVACLFCLGFFGRAALEILLKYGNVGEENVDKLWWIMIWLGFAFMSGTVGQISSTIYYASGDTKTPTRISMVTYTAYIPCKVAMFLQFGVMGLATATSIYISSNLFLQIFYLKKYRN